MKNILITGGAGFIGSHTCLNFLEKGFNIYIADSFINSSKKVFERLKKIIDVYGCYDQNKINIFEGDIRDYKFLDNIFLEALKKNEAIDGVIHFAGLKAVAESTFNPLKYWDVNVNGSINLFKVMKKNNCKTILFSSSATVYGNSSEIPFKESHLLKPTNPYGHTKVTIEKILNSIYDSDNQSWRICNLRYFNPIGAHPSGLIGEQPNSNPQNIFPIILQVAAGLRKKLFIYGNDWPTPDGTCRRDYIHIFDLSQAHMKAMEYMLKEKSCYLTLNVGTGKSISVLKLIKTFEKVNNLKINFEFINRRDGDVANSFADTSQLIKKLNWTPNKSLEDMCKDGWKWQKTLINL